MTDRTRVDESQGGGSGNPMGGQGAGSQPSGLQPGGRFEVGNSESSQKRPPHLSASDQAAQVGPDDESASKRPVVAAIAGGTDKVSADQQNQEPINPESMYARRPEEDPNHPLHQDGGDRTNDRAQTA